MSQLFAIFLPAKAKLFTSTKNSEIQDMARVFCPCTWDLFLHSITFLDIYTFQSFKSYKNEKRQLKIDLQITVKWSCTLYENLSIWFRHLRSLINILLVVLPISSIPCELPNRKLKNFVYLVFKLAMDIIYTQKKKNVSVEFASEVTLQPRYMLKYSIANEGCWN